MSIKIFDKYYDINLNILDLSYENLKDLPKEIWMFTHLIKLNLSYGGLTSLSNSIESLTILHVLDSNRSPY